MGPSPLGRKKSGKTELLALTYTIETDLPYLKDSVIDNVDFLSLDGWLGNWTLYHVQWAYCTPEDPLTDRSPELPTSLLTRERTHQ